MCLVFQELLNPFCNSFIIWVTPKHSKHYLKARQKWVLHVNVEMLLKLSDPVPVYGSSWTKNWLGLSKLIPKDICVHGNFYRYFHHPKY